MSSPASEQTMRRVVLVDADRRVQHSVHDALELSGQIEVVGSASDVRTALELIALRTPTVVVMDAELPEPPAAVVLARSIRSAWPSTRIVLIGWSGALEDTELAGVADAVVAKNASPDEFVDAVVDACCSP